jgi:hypothetical protein
MSEFIGVRVEGAKRLRSTLKAAGLDMKDLTKLNKEAAQIVVPVAQALAPVGSPVNGHIRTTIRAGATQRAGIIRAGNSKMPYGGPIHFGWPARGIESQPWIAIAAKQTEPQWVDNYFDGLMKVINSVQGA